MIKLWKKEKISIFHLDGNGAEHQALEHGAKCWTAWRR
jgi:hypothetical protein